MKLWVKILSVFFLIFLVFLPKRIEARSGCCSHHGGVCGCGCCDGSSLSSTCAPYYPSCNSPIIYPTSIPTKTPTKIPTALIPTEKPTLTPTEIISSNQDDNPAKVLNTTSNSNQSTSSENHLGSLLVLGGLGFGGYKLVKKFKNKKNIS